MNPVVVLDTNAVVGNKNDLSIPFAKSDVTELVEGARDGQYEVVVPELVLDEAFNVWAERITDQADALRGAGRRLAAAGVISDGELPSLDVGQHVAKAKAAARAMLESRGVTIAPYPTVGHKEVAGRALGRRRPFDSQGKDGYRDALVWETILEKARTGATVVLVSNDGRAFYKDSKVDGGILAGTLQSEVDETSGSVSVFNSIESAFAHVKELVVEARVARTRAAIDEVQRELDKGGSLKLLLDDRLADALPYLDVGDPRDFGLDVDAYEARIDIVEELEDTTIERGYLDDKGLLSLDIRARVAATVNLAVHPADAFILDEDAGFHVFGVDVEGRTATAATTLSMDVVFEVVLEHSGGEWAIGSLAVVSSVEPRRVS